MSIWWREAVLAVAGALVLGMAACAAEGPAMTREEFFQGIDLTLPGLGKVDAAVRSRDYDAAAAALLDYMRSRRSVKFFVNSWEVRPRRHAAADTRAADAICRHISQTGVPGQTAPYEMGPKVQWDADPYDDPEWAWGLNRHADWGGLANAYLSTADEKYAREYVAQLEDWVRSRPVVTDGKHNSSPSWRTIEAGIRMSSSWPEAWMKFMNSPSFTPEANLLLMMSMVDHAHHLAKNPTHGNWLTMEMNGLLHVGVLFPEYKESAAWRKQALDTLSSELTHQVYPDGTQVELTTGYHRVCIANFVTPLRLCALNAAPLPAEYSANLRKLYETEMYLIKPSGALPALNDADASVESMRGTGGWAGAVGDLKDAAARYGRPDMLYVATAGSEGCPPREDSHTFPYGGLSVMRGGWDRDALYLVFDAGPYGAGHQHEDKLSFEAYAYGETLLFDTGRDGYHAPVFRPYFLSTASHNTALVDGQGQARGRQPSAERMWVVSQPSGNPWESNPVFDYAAGVYDEGYGAKRDRTVTHRRQVVFVKNAYWLVVDRFEGKGEHSVDVLFHFAPGKVAEGKNSLVCRSQNPGRPNVAIVPFGPEVMTASVIAGQMSPCQGWISTGYDQRIPAPVADYRWTGKLPAEMAWLVFPQRPGPQALPDLLCDSGQYVVRRPDGYVDHILMRSGSAGTARVGSFLTDARVAVVTQDAEGRVCGKAYWGGRFLKAR